MPGLRYETFLILSLVGDTHPDHPTDLLAFLVIVYLVFRSHVYRLPIPSLLRTIAQDSTHYFLLIFTSHLVFELTLLLGRVRISPWRSTFSLWLTETLTAFNSTASWRVSDTGTRLLCFFTESFSTQQWKHHVRPGISLLPQQSGLNCVGQVSSGDDHAADALAQESQQFTRIWMEPRRTDHEGHPEVCRMSRYRYHGRQYRVGQFCKQRRRG